ncbi:hypothetical protein [Scytonema sp. PCC 10023]|uniref:hypothetical protein n=1 Tax=Scytonema sp. PCC 10023 TaxID=1680591 RepID=UPI0039C6D42F
MTQSWKNWSWKLGLGIAVATSAICSCGYYAMAENTKTPFPLISWTLGRPKVQINPPVPWGANKLRFKSIRSDAPANNSSSGKIYIYIQDYNVTSDPYPINPGQEVQLGMDICFNNTLTVELDYQINQEEPQIVGHKPVSSSSSSPLVFDGISNGAPYTLNYEVVPGGC